MIFVSGGIIKKIETTVKIIKCLQAKRNNELLLEKQEYLKCSMHSRQLKEIGDRIDKLELKIEEINRNLFEIAKAINGHSKKI